MDGGEVCDHISGGGTFGGEPSTSRRYHPLVLGHRDGTSGAFEGLMAEVLILPNAGGINHTLCLSDARTLYGFTLLVRA